VQMLTKRKTKKDFTLSWLLLFLLQCTVDIIDCFYKLSLAIPYIGTRFFHLFQGIIVAFSVKLFLRRKPYKIKGEGLNGKK